MKIWSALRNWQILCGRDKTEGDEAKQQILSGKNGVFDGVIETNTGETVGEQGKTLDAATITGKITGTLKPFTLSNRGNYR